MQILIKRKVDGPSVPELGTPTSVTFDSITVPLNRPSTGPAALAQYELQRSLDGSTWLTIATGPAIFGNPAAQFVDGGRIALTTYYYRARALDVAGRASAYSATVSATTAATVLPVVTSSYPLLSMYWVGSDPTLGGHLAQYQSATGVARMARCNFVVMQGWPELQSARGGVSNQDIAALVKAVNPDTKLFVYFDTEFVPKSSNVYVVRQQKIAAENWYVYNGGTSGTKRDSYFSSTAYAINNTDYVPKDSADRNAMEWMADFESGWIFGGTEGNELAPLIDGVFWDNVLIRPRLSADWNRDGTSDSLSSATTASWYRQGIASGVNRFKASFPTRQTVGNMAEFFQHEAYGLGPLASSEYQGLLHGGVFEHAIGNWFSPEVWNSTANFVTAIQRTEDAAIDPALVGFHSYPDDELANNYQAFRHAMACCLVTSNMSFMYTRRDGHQYWDEYDEYDFDLGPPTESRKTAATASGVWRRDYENGIVLWCPKGVSATVNLGSTFYRLRGTQQPAVNSAAATTSVTFGVKNIPYWTGQTRTSVTIAGREGLILSRTPT